MNNTAISANKEKLIFKNESHRKFYEEWLLKCRYQDVYQKALVYCLGINEDTRNHINEIYDYKEHEKQMMESRQYSVEELFCSGYARFFWEAIKLRYPEYCFYVDIRH